MLKLNLECGNNVMNGYMNLNSSKVQLNRDNLTPDTKFYIHNYENLDDVFEANSVDEIVFGQNLNILHPDKAISILQNWASKLKPGCKLIFSFIDARRIGKMLWRGDKSLGELHSLIYGDTYKNNMLLDMDLVVNTCKDINVDIASLSYDNSDIFGTVELVKNDSKN